MSFLRRLLLLAAFAILATPSVRASNDGEALDAMLMIELEHHWVVEIAGQRFGLIQFDTPQTTILLGGFDFDLPLRASAVVVPLAAFSALIAAGVVLHGRRRQFGFELA